MKRNYVVKILISKLNKSIPKVMTIGGGLLLAKTAHDEFKHSKDYSEADFGNHQPLKNGRYNHCYRRRSTPNVDGAVRAI